MILREDTPPPQQVLNGVGRWLEVTFGWKPANEGNILARPHQSDTVNCAICALNTIAHNIFRDQLWQQHSASIHRVSWLLEFDKHKRLYPFVEPVSAPKFQSTGIDMSIWTQCR
jgi:hypothetical protein